MPNVMYMRCERALIHEVDRLRQVIGEHSINYVIFDSIAFACDGPPEAAEIAGNYFRALRQLKIGSLHVAHITKGNQDQKPGANEQRPFGSAFWHNGARSTWFAKRTDATDEPTTNFSVGLYQRKANLGPLRPALGFQFEFTHDSTIVSKIDVRGNVELAQNLRLSERIVGLLKRGAMTKDMIVDELGADEASVRKVLNRKRVLFRVIRGADGLETYGLKYS